MKVFPGREWSRSLKQKDLCVGAVEEINNQYGEHVNRVLSVPRVKTSSWDDLSSHSTVASDFKSKGLDFRTYLSQSCQFSLRSPAD